LLCDGIKRELTRVIRLQDLNMSYFNDEIYLSTSAKYLLSVGGRKARISIPFIRGIENGIVINFFLCVLVEVNG